MLNVGLQAGVLNTRMFSAVLQPMTETGGRTGSTVRKACDAGRRVVIVKIGLCVFVSSSVPSPRSGRSSRASRSKTFWGTSILLSFPKSSSGSTLVMSPLSPPSTTSHLNLLTIAPFLASLALNGATMLFIRLAHLSRARSMA